MEPWARRHLLRTRPELLMAMRLAHHDPIRAEEILGRYTIWELTYLYLISLADSDYAWSIRDG